MAGKRAKQIKNQEKKIELIKRQIFEEAKQRYYDNLSGNTFQIQLKTDE